MDKIKIEGSYIQYAAGYQKDNITQTDIEKALDHVWAPFLSNLKKWQSAS